MFTSIQFTYSHIGGGVTVGQIINQKLFSFNTFIRFFIISTIFRSSKIHLLHRKMSISPLDFFSRRHEPTHSAVIPSSSNKYLHVVRKCEGDTYVSIIKTKLTRTNGYSSLQYIIFYDRYFRSWNFLLQVFEILDPNFHSMSKFDFPLPCTLP